MRSLNDGSEFKNFELIGRVTVYTFFSLLIIQLIIVLLSNNRGQCSFAFWHNLSFFSLLHWIPLINLNHGTELEAFFNEIAKIIQPFELPEFCTEARIENARYENMNIKNSGFINNSKELLLIYTIVVLYCVTVLILSKYTNNEKIEKMKKNIKWNVIIRLNLVVYLDFIAYSCINLNYFSGDSKCSAVNLLLSLFFIIVGMVFIMFFPIIIKHKINNAANNSYFSTFRSIITIIAEFKPAVVNSKYQYYSIFVIYRFCLGVSLIFLDNSPSILILMIAGFEFFIMIYIAVARPFEKLSESVTVFLTHFLTLALALMVGFRSMNAVSSDSKMALAIVSILIIWLTEGAVLIRFAFRLIYYQPSSLTNAAITNDANVSAVATFQNDKHMGNDLDPPIDSKQECKFSIQSELNKRSNYSEHSVEPFQSDPKHYINTYLPYQEDFSKVPTEKISENGTLGEAHKGSVKAMTVWNKSIEGSLKKADFFSENNEKMTENQKNESRVYNLPPVINKKKPGDSEEKKKIKDFLAKMKTELHQVGNKSLDI